jgi:4-amino-4-deoxy-L-arabinose transferase-like glycosyltransferase
MMKHSLIILVVVALLLGATTLAYPRTGMDTSNFTLVAQTIVHGGMPYRDTWDLKGPGIFYAYAVPVSMFGQNQIALRAFEIPWQLATALAVFAIGARIYGRNAGLLSGLLYLIVYYSQNFPMLGQPDGLLSLPLALSMLWLLRALEDDRFLDWCLVGTSVGVATLFKLPFGLIGVLMIIAAVTLRRQGLNQSLRRLSALAVGFIAPILLCAIYFQAKGALWDLVATQFLVAPQHALLNQDGHYIGCMLHNLNTIARVPLGTLVLLSLVPVFFSAVRKQHMSPSVKLVLGWFAVGLVVLFIHGEFVGYHYEPLYAPLAILTAGVLHSAYAAGWNARKVTSWLAVSSILVLLICVSYVVRLNVVYEWQTIHGRRPANEWDAVSTYLKQHTNPGDSVFVWGLRSAIYLETGLKPASRFLDTVHVAIPPKGVDYRGIFLKEFQSSQPKYFILHTIPISPNECGFSDPDMKKEYADFTSFKTLIDRDYERESPGDLGPFDVYRRRN